MLASVLRYIRFFAKLLLLVTLLSSIGLALGRPMAVGDETGSGATEVVVGDLGDLESRISCTLVSVFLFCLLPVLNSPHLTLANVLFESHSWICRPGWRVSLFQQARHN